MKYGSKYHLKSGTKTVDLGDILPGERILGEYSPSSKTYRKVAISRIVSTFISFLSPVLLALIELLGSGSDPLLNIGEILTTFGITIILASIILGLELAKYRKEFTARYVITSTRVVKIIKNRIKMDLAIDNIENAVITFEAIFRSKDYAVFFPQKGYMDLKGVNLNIPMVTSRVAELGHMEEESYAKVIKNKNGSVTIGNARIARTHLKNLRKIRKDMTHRSFLFLTEEMAREAARTYWDFVKNIKGSPQ